MGIRITKTKGGNGMKGMGVGGLLFFAIFWCGITGAFAGILAVTGWRVWDAQKRFVPVQGTVTESRVDESRGSKGGTTYKPHVAYRYTVAGREFHGDRYEFGSMSSSDGYARSSEVVRRCAPGAAVTVYYDPARPESAVLVRELPGGFFFMLLFLQPFLLVGIGVWFGVAYAVRDLWRRRRCLAGGPRTPPWPVPGWGVFRQTASGLAVAGGGRAGKTLMTFAVGYGITCFLSLFVLAFVCGGFSGGGLMPVKLAFAAALLVGGLAAGYVWGKPDSQASFMVDGLRGRIMLDRGRGRRPVTLRFDELAGWVVETFWTAGGKNSPPKQQWRISLLAKDEASRELLVAGDEELARHVVTQLSDLTGLPVQWPVEEPADPSPNIEEALEKLSQKSPLLGKLVSGLARFAKKRDGRE